MPELFDPLVAQDALEAAREARGEVGAADLAVTAQPPKARRKAPQKPPARDPLKEDFRVFLTLIWRHLGLPDPTPLQLSMAWWLQHGPSRAVLEAFRGAAKSWITAAFALWTLYCDPQKKVLVVSGSLKRSIAFTNFCMRLIEEVPVLQHLRPKPNQRQSAQAFDVGPALPDQSPSFHAAGITGQITGFRGDLVIGDDVETSANSMTVLMREKLADAIREFDAILKPGGRVVFLGTPQSDDSIYNKLPGRGYVIRVWPARYPNAKLMAVYGERLAPIVKAALKKDPKLVGHTTEPTRFPDEDLAKRELSWGRSGFALQFMLDTSLADAERYPLKLRDLIVMGLDHLNGPDLVSWGNDEKLLQQELPVLGFEGDRYYGPANLGETFSPWSTVIAAVDPSGRGADETAMTILAELHGRLFLLWAGAWRDGYAPETLRAIAKACVRFRVQVIIPEDNFGDGLFTALLQPALEVAWRENNKGKAPGAHGGTSIEPLRSARVQKELRILSALEPVTQQHRLVVSTEVITADLKSLSAIDGEDMRDRYSLFYQLTHLTRERDCLIHDDRLESLAIAVGHFAEMLGVDPIGAAQRREEDRTEAELEALFEDADEVAGYAKTPGGVKLVSGNFIRRRSAR